MTDGGGPLSVGRRAMEQGGMGATGGSARLGSEDYRRNDADHRRYRCPQEQEAKGDCGSAANPRPKVVSHDSLQPAKTTWFSKSCSYLKTLSPTFNEPSPASAKLRRSAE